MWHLKLTAINIMRRSTRNKSCHITRRVDQQRAHPSVSDQAGVEKLFTGSKTPVNHRQKHTHTRTTPNIGSSVINTNNVKRMYSITNDAKKCLNAINISPDNISENSSSTEKAK